MTYKDIKVILIRVKSRKFLTKECAICLEAINDETICRMLSCYHIYHVHCIDSWFMQDITCPNCKKVFNDPGNLKFNEDEFLQTINVDNEMFYSDHIIHPEYKLASSQELAKYDPFYQIRKGKRRQSFDYAFFLRYQNRKKNSMYQSRGNNGPLNIIKLPECEPPFWGELKSLNASD